jgi:hypothetical protein
VTEAETRTFTGSATASKPTTALTMAESRAQSAATGAGFGHCEMADSTVELTDTLRSYFATVTLSRIR